MNNIKSFTATGLVSSAMVLGLGTASVLAGDFKTTFTLDTAVGDPLVDTVIFNWSTDLTSGTVNAGDLTNWSIELLNGASSIYTDSVIIGGVVQPIGGVARTLVFDFNLLILMCEEG